MTDLERGIGKHNTFKFAGCDIRVGGKGTRPHGDKVRAYILKHDVDALVDEFKESGLNTPQKLNAIRMTAYKPSRRETDQSCQAVKRLDEVITRLGWAKDLLPKSRRLPRR